MPELVKNNVLSCSDCCLGSLCLHTNESISTRQYRLNKNEELTLSQGKFNDLYIVQEGALKAYEITPDGDEIIHGLFLKNDIYGAESIYRGQYLFSAKALSKSIVCKISYEDFLKLIGSNPRALSHCLALMSQQLSHTHYLKYLSAQQKVAGFLLDLLGRLENQTSQVPTLLLPCSYEQIGHYLGLAKETVSRILGLFKKAQLITIQQKTIGFLNVNTLKSVSDGATNIPSK